MTAELLNKATDEILDSETLNDGPVTEKHIRNFPLMGFSDRRV